MVATKPWRRKPWRRIPSCPRERCPRPLPASEPSITTKTAAGPGTSPGATPERPGEPEPDQVRLRDVWRASRARRKALRAEVRRFTVRARRRRAVWIGAAASLLLLVLGSLGAAYSPLFAVEQIRVLGAEQLDTAAVEAALADEVGTPLPLVDASAVKAALLAFPSSRRTRWKPAPRTTSSYAWWSARRSERWRPRPASPWWMPRASPSRRPPRPPRAGR